MFTWKLIAAVILHAFVMAPALSVLFAEQPAEVPLAVQLVRTVRQQEKWLDGVQSFRIRFTNTWERSPRAIDFYLAELRKQFPEGELSPKRFVGLRPTTTHEVDFAFDSSRLRKVERSKDNLYQLKIFDRVKYLEYIKYLTHEQEQYSLLNNPTKYGWMLLNDLSWPTAAPHNFWFSPTTEQAFYETNYGVADPESFVLVGKEDYRGHPCYVLQLDSPIFVRWFVGVQDHHLHGTMWGKWLPPGTEEQLEKFAIDLTRRYGGNISQLSAFEPWLASLAGDKQREVDRIMARESNKLSHPIFESTMTDFKEVSPGQWFPRSQGIYIYHGRDADGSNIIPFVKSSKEIRVTDIQVNQPLADELFVHEMIEGVKVADFRHGPVLVYKYKKDRTNEEWEEIFRKGKVNQDEMDGANRAMDELVGAVAPAFPEDSIWLNSKPLKWESLRGSVVLVDFWADWCGPCRNDLRGCASIHDKRNENRIAVIGIHWPGSERESIEKVMKSFKMEYPVCVDVTGKEGLGELISAFRIRWIPHTFVIDRDGKIAGHGTLSEMFEVANKILRAKN